MTKNEIEKIIKREKRRLEYREEQIDGIKRDICTIRKGIRFWEEELEKAKK